MGAPQYPSAQSTFDDVPPLAWATPMAAGHGGYLPSMAYPPVSAQSASGLEARAQQNGSMYPTTAYRNEMVAAVAPVNTYPETTYQPSPSVLPSPPVPQLPTQHAAAPSPPSIQRHSRDRRSQSHPYPLSVKVEDKANTLASPLTSPIRPAHHPGHSRQPTQVQTSARRSSPSRGSWSPGRSSPSRQTTSNSRSGVPLSPLPSQRQIEKKPPLACLFCRGRKIACGPPVAGSLDRTCNARGGACSANTRPRAGVE
ncbi:hypothetical protein CPB83DRAFT_76886 [Crepidotus variabilis]|uniref:Uncharacterized protein n=1 Tax=Crepidotus variabilis TaxID=179855 RepID=A0A9P6EM10_9AGAR|nr:hypothetical protein CPB83DRAFT_76886 [Crepidotus variabilis]